MINSNSLELVILTIYLMREVSDESLIVLQR